MANDKIKVQTPKGLLHWVNISGKGKENYNEDGYDYVATVFVKKEDAADFIKQVEDVHGVVPKGKNLKAVPYRDLFQKADGTYFTETANKKAGADDVATDMIAIAAKTGTTFEDGKTKKINVYNASAGKISLGEKKIGNGSVGKISGTLKRNENGKDISVSFFLNGVQLSKFEEYSGDDGFEADPDGEFDGVEPEFEADNSPDEPAEKAKPRL